MVRKLSLKSYYILKLGLLEHYPHLSLHALPNNVNDLINQTSNPITPTKALFTALPPSLPNNRNNVVSFST